MANSIPNITDEEIELLKRCKSDDDWNKACFDIKRPRNGHYPPDWWPKVKLSGLMDQVLNSFGADSDIRLGSVNEDGSFKVLRRIKT